MTQAPGTTTAAPSATPRQPEPAPSMFSAGQMQRDAEEADGIVAALRSPPPRGTVH